MTESRASIRYPAPLRPGDRIGVTAPSSGVDDELWPRVELTRTFLEDKGFEVEIGECMHTPSHVSAPKQARAAELMQMLTDPGVRAVVPPWGGETGIDLLDCLDFEAVSAAEPTWCVGFSDTSTWLTRARKEPGTAYEYNDVRVNVLALAALNVWRRPLPGVLK